MLTSVSEFIQKLPSGIQAGVEHHIALYIDAANTLSKEIPSFQTQYLALKERDINTLLTAFVGSEYLAQACIESPALVFRLLSPTDLARPYAKADYIQKIQDEFDEAVDDADFSKRLRQLRKVEMVRLIWRDLNRISDMLALTQELSNFADVCIEYALKWGVSEAEAKYGHPKNTKGITQAMSVIGMGKLGARELNLSSDIDLIFVYGEQGETMGGARSVSNQEFFLFVSRVLIRLLDTHSVDGFVFRVDMRLRPYGDSGPLICTLDAMAQYYQEQGREWERYAMIKARAVAGDQVLGRSFFDLIRSFVYRKYIDFGAIDAMRQMKNLINAEVRRKKIVHNIKIGPGGIREIEFVGQVFQLIHGGRHKVFQIRPILQVLDLLAHENHMDENSVQSLRDAYFFLRNTEHAIQAYQDKQTQLLPENDEAKIRLAYVMGFESWQAFDTALQKHRDIVRVHFDDLIADPKNNSNVNTDLKKWQDFWLLQGGEHDAPFLASQGFLAPLQVLAQLDAFKESHAYRLMDHTSIERVNIFMPLLLSALEQANDKELALLRILPLVQAILRRSVYLTLLIENPGALKQLILLTEASEWIAAQLTQMPVLLDELLNVSTLYQPPQQSALQDELRQQLLRIPEEDFEEQLYCLRMFKQSHVLRVAAAEVTGALPLMKVSDYLTYIAETILEYAFRLAWHFLTDKYGRPVKSPGEVCDPDFIVVAYGKLGGIELSYGSDLDVVFIHDADEMLSTDGDNAINNTVFFVRLGQRMMHILDTKMASGQLYEVDVRLRPSGVSGVLVPSLKAFNKYQLNDAWTWEHQALVRTRVVAGCAKLRMQFDESRATLLSQKRDIEHLRTEVASMRYKMMETLGSSKIDCIPVGELSRAETSAVIDDMRVFNIKHDPGGVVDIEFIVQFCVLAWAHRFPSLYRYSDNVRIIEAMSEEGVITPEQARELTLAYLSYRSVIHLLALLDGDKVISATQYVEYNLDRHRVSIVQLWAEFFLHPSM